MAQPPRSRREALRIAGRSAAVLLTAGVALGATSTGASAAVSFFRWCNRCQSMWFINGNNSGHCPVSHLWDHNHYSNGSGVYTIRRATEPAVWFLGRLEHGWGVCPIWPTVGHSPGEPVPDLLLDSYRLETVSNNNGPGGQANWRWCRKCNVLFFAGNSVAATRCPAGGNHDGSLSDNYLMRF